MTEAIDFAVLKPEDALAYFRAKGFAPSLNRFSWLDVWREEHDRAFTVAKATSDDVLGEIRDALDQALENGLTFETFKKSLQPKLESLGWWGEKPVTDPKTGERKLAQLGSPRRLNVIYDTNIRTANSAGRWNRIQRSKTLMPYLTYIQVDRPSAREAHKRFHGITLPVDHVLWRKIFTPNGFFCACITRQISERVMKREGLRLTTEEELEPLKKTRRHTNRRTGEVTDVPVGIDPGFDRNPGIARFDPSAPE